ncbi:hypothetical protein BDV36DRAFT_285701 [Aspergillus pseudocaelatus]|uniref:Uncharacterized protein n=1 Tax=Aspergillus pseudocaelatus TaxID=1825620 RepID=A0ABQ6WD16_9EURO|nr:hypothetical protein BDV36DRAFT_285701 [Aspergillus pseudocaelatus]
MPGYTQAKLAHEKDLGKGMPPRQQVTIDLPEPTYQRSSQRSPVLGSTPFRDVDLERGGGFQFSTMDEAKKAPKKKRYIFGFPDNPLEDSESDNEWMRHIDGNEIKPETNNSQRVSEQRRITCCHNTSELTHKRSSISCGEVSVVIVILVVAGFIILLPLLLWRK